MVTHTNSPKIISQVDVVEYVVESGDYLIKIANELKAPLDEIVNKNNIEDEDHIEVGQKLIISTK